MNLTRPQKLLAAGQLQAARDALPPAGQSTDARTEIIRSRIDADVGDHAGAVDTLNAAIDRFPAHAPLHLFKGINLWDLHQPQPALESFNKVLELQKKNDLAVSYRALCYLALGRELEAADTWRNSGFSDNTMFRVRTVEYVELAWLRDGTFMDEVAPETVIHGTKFSQRKALRQFYRRDFNGMLKYVSAAPTDNELEAFLAATAHEILRHYDAAQAYLDAFLPRRAEWPDPLVAINARLMVRRGDIADAAREFENIVIMGPEDFGVNYYMGIICLAYEKRYEARQYFLRALTNYMVDTLEFQWWQIEQTLLNPTSEKPTAAAGTEA